MPVTRSGLDRNHRVEYEIEDDTDSSADEVRGASVFPAAYPPGGINTPRDVNLGGAIIALHERIAPIYAEIAHIVINPHMELGTVQNIMIKIRQVRNMLLTMEHLATAEDVYLGLNNFVE